MKQDEYLPYSWPCKGITPAEKQKLTSTFMVYNPHSFVLNDPGTGKTISALWAADFLMSQYSRYSIRCLILAPLSTLREVWRKEIVTHMFGRRSCAIVHGTTAKRVKSLKEKVDFYIMNFDGLKINAVALELAKRDDIKLVVVDESTAFSEFNTLRHKAGVNLLQSRPYLWLMTGTPVVRSHMAAHGQARLAHEGYQESKRKFKQRTTWQLGIGKCEPMDDAYDKARELLQPSIRIPRRAMHDLPASIPQKYEVPFSEAQNKLYKELKKEYKAAISGGGEITAVHEGALRLKLLQIACGSVYDSSKKAHTVDSSPRILLLANLIKESEDKLLVFAPFTSVLDMLYRTFKPHIHCALVTGKTSLKARSEIFNDFQNKRDPHVIFADPGCMSHGLTLTAATSTVWFGPTDKSETYVQANYRIDRPGKTKPTYTIQIMSCPIEREIYKRLDKRQRMEGAMLAIMEAGE